MKYCPKCNRAYYDKSYFFCLEDGAVLSNLHDMDVTQRLEDIRHKSSSEPKTVRIISSAQTSEPIERKRFIYTPIILLALALFGLIFWVFQKSDSLPLSQKNVDEPVPSRTASVANGASSNSSNRTAQNTQTSPSANSLNKPDNHDTVLTETNVLLRYLTNTKTNDYPMPGESITLQAKGKSFNAQTNSKGVALFSGVPCGKQVKIIFSGYLNRSFTRYLRCGSQTVEWQYHFDSYAIPDGEIEQVK